MYTKIAITRHGDFMFDVFLFDGLNGERIMGMEYENDGLRTFRNFRNYPLFHIIVMEDNY